MAKLEYSDFVTVSEEVAKRHLTKRQVAFLLSAISDHSNYWKWKDYYQDANDIDQLVIETSLALIRENYDMEFALYDLSTTGGVTLTNVETEFTWNLRETNSNLYLNTFGTIQILQDGYYMCQLNISGSKSFDNGLLDIRVKSSGNPNDTMRETVPLPSLPTVPNYGMLVSRGFIAHVAGNYQVKVCATLLRPYGGSMGVSNVASNTLMIWRIGGA